MPALPRCRSLSAGLGLLALFLAVPNTVAAEVASPPRYNVLFVVADDLRPALGCYGDGRARTPHLDRLAARSVRFDRAYVQYPVCNPSRASFLTGTRPEHNGITGNATFFRDKLPDAVTLPELFRRHGATALSYGKIFHAGLVEGVIATNLLDSGRSWDEARMFRPTPTGSAGPRRNLTGDQLAWCTVGAMDGVDDDQSDGQTAAATIAAMERLGSRPWFIAAGFHRPHDPFLVARPYVERFPPGSLVPHRDPADATPIPALALGGGAFPKAFARFDDRDRVDFLTHYHAGVSQTDAQVGRLMDALDRLDLWKRTIVVFLGDHGYHLGERGWWNKNTLFELSCRVPLLIAAPGVRPSTPAGLVELVDLYPTLAGLCGLAPPPNLAGRSLEPMLADPARDVRDAAITHVTRGAQGEGFSLRTTRWRYTEWNRGRDGVELYDHSRDPGEWHNLADDPRHASDRAALAARLEAHRRSRPLPPP